MSSEFIMLSGLDVCLLQTKSELRLITTIGITHCRVINYIFDKAS